MNDFHNSTSDDFLEYQATGNSPGDEPTAPPAALSRWARASSWTSFVVAGLVIFCIAVIAIPQLSRWKSWRSGNPVDWILRLGGAKPDQTFQRYLRESAEKSQREWDDKYRDSPMYQFNSKHVSGPLKFDTLKFEPLKFEPIPYGKKK